MAKKKREAQPPDLRIEVRSYPHGRFVNVYLRRWEAGGHELWLWGELTPPAAEELLAVLAPLGWPVERTQSCLEFLPTRGTQAAGQLSLFEEKET